MTREQIEAMSDRELDAAVAKRVFECDVAVISRWGTRFHWMLGEHDKQVPYFSTDISAAFEVVEEMRRLGYTAVIRLQPEHHCDVCFRDGRGAWEAYSPSAPLAICRAALLAVRGEEKA